MNDCTCGRNGWFSPSDPDCPIHGLRGTKNEDYQRGLHDAPGQARVKTPIERIQAVLLKVPAERAVQIFLDSIRQTSIATQREIASWIESRAWQ